MARDWWLVDVGRYHPMLVGWRITRSERCVRAWRRRGGQALWCRAHRPSLYTTRMLSRTSAASRQAITQGSHMYPTRSLPGYWTRLRRTARTWRCWTGMRTTDTGASLPQGCPHTHWPYRGWDSSRAGDAMRQQAHSATQTGWRPPPDRSRGNDLRAGDEGHCSALQPT
jgi:hypothetical protein